MQYDQFLAVPTELKLNIIRKCYPIPYVRLRQSCRLMDDFSEKNRRQLGIYCFQNNPRLEVRLNKSNYYLSADNGIDPCMTKLVVPITRENTCNIRRLLSGFAFTHFRADDGCLGYKGSKMFEETMEIFLEFANDFHVKNVILFKVAPDQAKRLLDIWAVESLVLLSVASDIQNVLGHDPAKKIPSVKCSYLTNKINENDIVEMAQKRKVLRIDNCGLTCCIVWKAIHGIYEGWTKRTTVPDSVEFIFPILDGNEKTDQLYLPFSRSVYCGWIPLKGKSNKYRNYTGECVIYIVEGIDLWSVLSIYTGDLGEGILVETARSREDLAIMLMAFITDVRFNYTRVPLDFSLFYTHLQKSLSLDEIRNEFIGILCIVFQYSTTN